MRKAAFFLRSKPEKYQKLTSEEELDEAKKLIWSRKTLIGDRACTVRELASDSQEPERCPERSLRRARAQFQRMFMDHLSLDFDDGDYLDEKFGKLSACAVDSVELESRTEFWFKRWSKAKERLRRTEEYVTALEREIELVEMQKAAVLASKCGRVRKFRCWLGTTFRTIRQHLAFNSGTAQYKKMH